eukprot:CAMPEP_0179228688 /NCGR_PEP_ID=MMETSP0797-20121207/9954_1 /TAXON_ID=47934 /ORGANISM="Dinophysis acuminata, Strain DAEP01" /LENGTH=500 /DNA_ID=CAMNT_0020935747 /DNA_START=102 /DNA_END=1604 /DNA_ORIENTATION=-
MGASGSQTGRVEDRYYLQKVKLGQGSFGTVWRAVDRSTNDVVAIKQLDKAAMPKMGVRKQDIEREIKVMQGVSHDNITRLLGQFESPHSIYLALEYCDGGDFGDKVNERGLNLAEHEAAEWMKQIISAIAALHAKCICHRDIKPDNFMVHGDVLKLSDFGLAVFLPAGKLLVEKCGTPAFMAPELHKLPRQSRGYNNLCDVWAAGVTMYMLMFGGRHPFLSSAKQIDESRLLAGSLDFSGGRQVFGFGMPDHRYSDTARRLCKRLVEPDVTRRASAEAARKDAWLLQPPSAPRTPTPRSASFAATPTKAGSQQDQAETEAKLHKRIEALEVQVKIQQEQNESQWEALVHGTKVIQQLKEKHKSPARPGANEVEAHTPAAVAPPSSVLKAGVKCRYNSSTFSGWVPAVVQGFNEMDATYNLDVRDHARIEQISPAPNVPAPDAWPPGTLVYYESSSAKNWLPAVVLSFSASAGSGAEGTYNLDLRENAKVDRIRPRTAAHE